MKPFHDSVVAIVGLGLMGGSLALALRATNACRKIIAIDRDDATLARAHARNAADETSAQLELIGNADLIVLATPVRAILALLPRIGDLARDGAVVMDLGSTKGKIVHAMEFLPATLQPIGAHPMCGKERAGFDAADAELFRGSAFVLTPLARTSPATLSLAQSLAQTIGARPRVLDAARHDKLVATVSHLPYALAATLMQAASEGARADDLLFAIAASGFRDSSRLAASDPQMMLDILLTNSENIAGVMRDYSRRFAELADAVYEEDEAKLRETLETAAKTRKEMIGTRMNADKRG